MRKGQQAVTGPRGSPPSVVLEKLLARSESPPFSPKALCPVRLADIAWVWWHTVTRSSYKEQKAARGQPCSPLSRIFTQALEAADEGRRHCSLSRLLFLWLAS